jgi:mannose-6-phosphate isomerase
VLDLPRRGIVQFRQIYAACELGRLGWDGPWAERTEEALALADARLRTADGPYLFSTRADGAPADARIDLYTQAFALFGMANAYGMLGRPPALKAQALDLLSWLRANRAHPDAGFEETSPRSLPLKSNPHMHLFEAALAWVEVDDAPEWRALANEIAELCARRFLHPDIGALREYFDGEWAPVAGQQGRITEPGHQFEWAWLMWRWADLCGGDPAPWRARAERLVAHGETYGICPMRGAPIAEADIEGAPIETYARLWPSTERLKAAVAQSRVADGPQVQARAEASVTALFAFFETPTPGLWRDRWLADGSFVQEGAPASSFYHIVCGFSELIRRVGD